MSECGCPTALEAQRQLDEARARLAKQAAALEFYAKARYSGPLERFEVIPQGPNYWHTLPKTRRILDTGEIARAALIAPEADVAAFQREKRAEWLRECLQVVEGAFERARPIMHPTCRVPDWEGGALILQDVVKRGIQALLEPATEATSTDEEISNGN